MNRLYTKEENTARANEILYNSQPFIVRLFTKLDKTKPISIKCVYKLHALDCNHCMRQTYLKKQLVYEESIQKLKAYALTTPYEFIDIFVLFEKLNSVEKVELYVNYCVRSAKHPLDYYNHLYCLDVDLSKKTLSEFRLLFR